MPEQTKTRHSRQEMVDIINGGGSVLYKNGAERRLIITLDALPREEEIAQSEEERAAVASDLRAQMDALNARLAALEGGDTVAATAGRVAAGEAAPGAAVSPAAGSTNNPQPPSNDTGDLPADFPGRSALLAAGITTLAAVPRDRDALIAVEGIGPASADRIMAALPA